MFYIQNLSVSHSEKVILKKIDLKIENNEIHAIMGPNGSGKTTLSKAIIGDPHYTIDTGKLLFKGEDILSWEVEKRSLEGIFLANQSPIEIPGVSNSEFLRMIYNNKRKYQNLEALDPLDFDILLKEKVKILGLSSIFIERNLNEGFSGGEKKKNEILQMLLLNPSFSVLDEIDSGLDIDALKWISNSINKFLEKNSKSILMITHFSRIFNYIKPNFVHILYDGEIIESGDLKIAYLLEEKGYQYFLKK